MITLLSVGEPLTRDERRAARCAKAVLHATPLVLDQVENLLVSVGVLKLKHDHVVQLAGLPVVDRG